LEGSRWRCRKIRIFREEWKEVEEVRIRVGDCSGAGAIKDPVVDEAYLVLALSLVI
jgi:hypothetical protein